MSKVNHMCKRGNIYYFRIPLPRSVIATTGKREFKKSLRTSNRDVAKHLCRKLSGKFETLMRQLRYMQDISIEKIDEIARKYFDELLIEVEENLYLISGDKIISREDEIAGLEIRLPEIKKDIQENNYNHVVKATAIELLEKEKLGKISKYTPEVDFLCERILRADYEKCRIFKGKLEANFAETMPVDPIFEGMIAKDYLPPIAGEEEKAEDSLGEVIEKYITYKVKHDWKESTAKKYRNALNVLLRYFDKNKPIKEINKGDAIAYRDTVQSLPANFDKKPEFKGKALHKIVELKKEEATMKFKTSGFYYEAFISLLNWCVDEGYLENNPAPKHKVGKKEKNEAKKTPFTAEHLEKLFNSPVYTGCKGISRRGDVGDEVIKDGLYWFPLIGLFTGMRLGEIAQLTLSDVKEDEGVLYFNIHEEGEVEGYKKNVKTASSVRVVPIHPELKNCGFLDHIDKVKKDGSEKLFPDVKVSAGGDPGANFSKKFSRYLEKIGVKEEKISFHSFRHNFRDGLAESGGQEYRIVMLMGHSSKTMTFGTYGSKLSAKNLAGDVANIKYKVDLKHLYT